MRFGLVGLGWAARAFHLPALRTVPGAQIVGGADSSAEQRESFSRATGVPVFGTLDELLERTLPDVVVVGTPPDSHLELCLGALAGGAHVICEKPFVGSAEEADRVLAAAEAAGRRVAVNHEYREKPIFRAVKERIGAPDVGRLVFCQIVQLMDLAPWEEPVPWRRAMPNRTLFEGGVHLVDLLLMLYGERPEAVYARRSAGLDSEREADAIQLLTLEFPGGRLAQITIDRLCRAGTRYIELRADCEHASLRASHGGRVLLQLGMKRAERPGLRFVYGLGGVAWLERGTRRKTLARSPRNPGVVATGALFRKIAAALEEGREPPSSGREARDGLEVVDAAYRSAATGLRVELAP
ncbi:MAG TPA: Gfo/Idh/MocA family oxidoreductase [Gaiellaceae bacterium]|jgi:predicted dehydrogenase|nr:Gfo/Idh/MocA family oxidoreductase [Gaiellaceae bacterium]